VPTNVAPGFPRIKGASPSKPDAELWFKKDVLANDEWLRDPTGKARRIAEEIIDQFPRKD